MEPGLNSLRQYTRNLAQRARLPGFWRWWSAELAPLIPAASRGAMRRRLTRPAVEFVDGEAIFWRPLVVDDELRLVEVGRVALSGDPGEVAAAGRAAMNALAIATSRDRMVSPRVVVVLPPKQVMRKTLVLPAAVEENLSQALSYDLDRHTPFRPEQLYFDAAVIDRRPAVKTISVDWVAALKTVVDNARRQVEDWGGVVVAVVPGPASTRSTRLNLIPAEGRPRRVSWRRWQLWAPAAIFAVGLLAVLVVPLLQKREYAIALNKQTESARARAEAADSVRSQLERQQGDYNYALAKKYAYPSTIQVIDDVTRLLPDDTWITQLEIKSAVRGKENVRELTLRGESANAGALISTLEDSKLVEQAALQSPTTKLQPGPGEVFVLGSRLRAGTPPDLVPVAAAVAAAPEPAPAAPAPVQPPSATRASTAATPAGAPATTAATPAAGPPPATSAAPGPAPPATTPSTPPQAAPAEAALPAANAGSGGGGQSGIAPARRYAPSGADPAASGSAPPAPSAGSGAAPGPGVPPSEPVSRPGDAEGRS